MWRKQKLVYCLLQLLLTVTHAQPASKESFHFWLGANFRLSPIYTQPIADLNKQPSNNEIPVDDEHYTGLGFHYAFEKEFAKVWSATFTQQFRYDVLVRPFPFAFQYFPSAYHVRDQNSFSTDFGLDLNRSVAIKKSTFKIGIGLGIAGIGSNYVITEAYTNSTGQTLLVQSQRNFVYPFASMVTAWQHGNFLASLRMNYCPSNPGFYEAHFLQPQIALQYRAFSFD